MTLQSGTTPVGGMPIPARVLGIAGLIPFLLGALAVGFAPEIKAEAASALLAYGAIILSFLGGIRWGFAVLEGSKAGWAAYGTGVLPSLAAWLGVLTGGPAGLLVLAVALALWYLLESALPPAFPLPAWYLRLRGALTAVAVLALAAAAFLW